MWRLSEDAFVALISLTAVGFRHPPNQPVSQNEQGPQGAGMVGFALAMFGEEFHGGGRVNPDLFQAPLFQSGGRPFFQPATQPAADRYRETPLAPVHEVIRQVTPGIALQKNLRL